MPLPLTIFSKFNLNESNLKLVVFSVFAMYFLVLYEMFPQFIFDGLNFLYTLVIPLLAIVVGLNIKKIKLKNLSLKSIKNKKANGNSFANSTNDVMVSDSTAENSDIDALLAGASPEKSEGGSSEIDALLAGASPEKSEGGSSEIDALLAGASPEKSEGGSSEIDALLAGAESTESTDNSSNNSEETSLMVMEKMEPLENDMQTIKTDFDQFKQDLTNVKEEVEGLSSTFETTLTDIKLLTTDLNNPLNFMQDDSFKENIQTINVDELINQPNDSTLTNKSESKASETLESKASETLESKASETLESKASETLESQIPDISEKDIANLPEDIITLVDELSKDFVPEQVFELTQIHCKTSKITIDDKQLMSVIDKRYNSNSLKKNSDGLELEKSSEKSQLSILNEEI